MTFKKPSTVSKAPVRPVKREMVKRVKTAKSAEWMRERARNSLSLFHMAAKRVPAYKAFLKEKGINPKTIRTWKDFQDKVPATSKADYLKKYSLADICWDGEIARPAVFSSTSGSTGKPFYFQRLSNLEEEYSILLELFLENGSIVPSPKHPTLVIIGFGMGVWIGGVLTHRAFDIVSHRKYPVSILATGVNKAEILTALRELAPSFTQTIMVGYPPFVKDVIDEAEFEGIDLKKLNLRFLSAAEAYTEHFRDYVAKKAGVKNVYRDMLNIYGTADIGAMAYETPTSILVRRLAMDHRKAFEKIFGQLEKTPTLAQYNPTYTSFEAPGGEILLTGNSAVPLIRYAIGDHGGVHSFDEVKEILASEGIDLKKEAKKHDVPLYQLPFVYVYERTDLSTKLYGAIMFPEHVKLGFQKPELEKFVTGRFTMTTEFDKEHNEFLELNVELKRGVESGEPIRKALIESIVKGLCESSSEYHNNYLNMKDRVIPHIIFWPHDDPKYFNPNIKQKWVVKST